MKFFLDTANLNEIKEAAKTGLIDGVTTNPSLVAKEGRDFKDVLTEICEIIPGPVSAEVIATDYETMVSEGRELSKVAKNITIKVPLTPDGLRACKVLSDEGTPVNVTLCFSPAQALLAAKAGAAFISPFLGRLDDIGSDGMSLITEIVSDYSCYDFKTEILAASIRHPMHVVDAAKLGADVCTMPKKVFEMLYKHPLTDIGIERFLNDWKNAQG